PSRKRRIKKAIMYATVGVKGSVLEKFRAIKEASFEGVEPMSHMNQDEVMKALEATGLKAASTCCNTHWNKPVSDPDPKVREEGLAGLKQALRDAKRYGASSVLFVPAVVNKQVSYADAYKRSQAQIGKAIPLAVMKALDEIRYEGWGIAEQGGADSTAGLKKLSEEMDLIFAS